MSNLLGGGVKIDKEVKYLTKDEIKKVFKVIRESDSKYALRDEVLFRVGFETACRVSEMGLFKLDDFNADTRDIYCRRNKNGNNNTVRLTKETSRLLKKYIQNMKNIDTEFIFVSQFGKPISRKTIDYITKKYFKMARIKDTGKYHFHVLRHTRAVTMLEDNCTLEDIKYLLGHKKFANTLIYAQFSSNYKKSLFDKLDSIEYESN